MSLSSNHDLGTGLGAGVAKLSLTVITQGGEVKVPAGRVAVGTSGEMGVTGAVRGRDHEGMPGPYVIRGSVVVPEAELRWRFSRSSGPGGQHVNTSDSKAELLFDVAATSALPEVWKQRALERLAPRLVDGVLTVRASEHRSQLRNREMALVRLASLLAEATAPPPKARRATKIPRGINERRLREKKARAETKRGRAGRDW